MCKQLGADGGGHSAHGEVSTMWPWVYYKEPGFKGQEFVLILRVIQSLPEKL